MAFLYDWISKIVIFILMGTIIEMLLPSNAMKKYVHFIFGLLFLLLLAQPIFHLFKTDITEQIAMLEKQMDVSSGQMDQTKINIEKQKEDIQAEQVAYIWTEMTEQYMQEANEKLEANHHVQVNDISFVMAEDSGDSPSISTYTVSIEPYEDKEESIIESIEPVEISPNKKQAVPVFKGNKQAIEQTLRDIWQLEDEVTIELQWEGGTI